MPGQTDYLPTTEEGPPLIIPSHHHHQNRHARAEMIDTNESMLMSPDGLVSSLHRIGHLYWHRPDTADCLVEVTRMGIAQHLSSSRHRSSASLPSFASSSRAASAPEGTHVRHSEQRLCAAAVRRESAPTSMSASTEDACCRHSRCSAHNQAQTPPTRIFRLHKDFLTSQSDLFRELLTSSRPLSPWCVTKGFDRIELKPRAEEDNGTTRIESLCIELPDPASFGALVEYLYMGDFGKLIEAIESGRVRWEGVMLNCRHLGISQATKTRLGAWWYHRQGHLSPSSHRRARSASHSNTSSQRCLSKQVGFASSPLASPRRSPSWPRLDVSAQQNSMDHPRANSVGSAAARQLLLGGRRRRALSSLALYSSTGSYASISHSVGHRE